MFRSTMSRGNGVAPMLALGVAIAFGTAFGRRTNQTSHGRSSHRFNVLWGLAAIAAFLLALPAAAMACIPAQQCILGGGIVIGGNYCGFGTYSGQTVCSGVSAPEPYYSEQPPATALDPFFFLLPKLQPWDDTYDDPQFWKDLGGYTNFINSAGNSYGGYGSTGQGGQFLGGPVSVKMYGQGDTPDPGVIGDITSIHSSGGSLSDSAGAIAGSVPLPGYQELSYGGGITAKWNASQALPTGQHLWFDGTLNYTHDEATYGASAAAPGLTSVGGMRQDVYVLLLSATYANPSFYVKGQLGVDYDHTGYTNNATVATGNTDGGGYGVNLAVGKLFPIFNTTGAAQSPMLTKAAPSVSGGYAVYLDTSGHVAYEYQRANSFTDTSGFIWGVQQTSMPIVGGMARLVSFIPAGDHSWVPYIGGSVDWLPGYKNTIEIPNQALATADTLTVGQATTFWGLRAGVDLLDRRAAKVGLQGFYETSADMNIVGGNVYLKIPFEAPAEYADSGITAAKK